MQCTTFVLTAVDPPAPVLLIAPDVDEEIDHLPLVTSLHRIGDEVVALVHAEQVGEPVVVSELWVQAVAGYEDGAKVVLVLQVPPDVVDAAPPGFAAATVGGGVKPWVPMLLAQQITAATRDVPVSSGTGLTDVTMVRARYSCVDAWAHQRIGRTP